MTRIHRFLALFALAFAAACTDRPGAFEPSGIPAPEPPLAALQCTVTVHQGEMRCGSAATGGALGDLLVGGQGVYVQLRSSNARYDSTNQVFTLDVTMQNLLGQPVGTEDGSTASGIRIFFHTLPAPSAGTGTVEVNNPDGTGIFTGVGQPYFEYPEILAAYERTAPKPWKWDVPPTVESFSFQVYVSARVPNEQGVLRWTRDEGDVVSRNVYAVWGTGPNDIWAGGSGVMMYNNGTRWVVIPGEWDVSHIHGTATDDVWAVGGGIRHFDGRRWTQVTAPALETWNGVWAHAPGNAYATSNDIVARWDGASWQTLFGRVPGRGFSGVWGFGANDVFVSGNWYDVPSRTSTGFVWHWDGTSWDSTAVGGFLTSIWGSSPDDLWAVGTPGLIYHFDGAAWSRVGAGLTTTTLREVWGTGPDDVWAVGGGGDAVVLHWDGAAWTAIPTGLPPTPLTGGSSAAAAVYAPNPDKVYVVGYQGLLLKRSGGQWQPEATGVHRWIQAVQPVSENDIVTAQCEGVRRKSGSPQTWQTLYTPPAFTCLEDVWITPGASQIFAVGGGMGDPETPLDEGLVAHWDGTRWTETWLPQVQEITGVFGLDSAHVWAVGWGNPDGLQYPHVFFWDGTSWTEMPLPDVGGGGMLYGVWASSTSDVWAVGSRVFHWDGEFWTEHFPYQYSGDYRDVWGTGSGDVFLAGTRVAHWNGSAWSTTPLRGRAEGVWGTGAGDVYVVGYHNVHFNGSAWTDINIETASDLYDIAGLDARNVWAVGLGGAVMRGRR